MDASHPLSIESFSYSWLINLKPSLESLDDSLGASFDASDEASFIEMDPKMPPSKRFFRKISQDFNFDFPASESPLTLVHADEIFANGLLLPFFVDRLKIEAYDASESISSPSISSNASKILLSSRKLHCSSLRRCRRLSRQLFQKYLDFLMPLFRRVRGRRSGSKTSTFHTRIQVEKNWVCSPETSPRTSVASPRASVASSACNWRRSCDSESSIYDAVQHCKRSIGK